MESLHITDSPYEIVMERRQIDLAWTFTLFTRYLVAIVLSVAFLFGVVVGAILGVAGTCLVLMH